MTEQKARKRDVRTRMTKTGERYTAARRNVVKPEPLPPTTGRAWWWHHRKGPSKSTAAIRHERLPDAGAVKDMRAFWKERLGVLADLLAG